MLHKVRHKYQQHKLKRAQKREARQRQLELIRNNPSAFDEAVISWIAPETVRHQHGPVWKVIMGLIVLAFIGGGIYYGAWTFSLAMGAFVLAYYVIHLDHPKAVEIKISEIGIKIGYRKYSYSQIRAFWLIYDPPFVQTLNIRVSGQYVSDLTIQLGSGSPAAVREFLIGKIPELEGQSEKLGDIFLRLFKI